MLDTPPTKPLPRQAKLAVVPAGQSRTKILIAAGFLAALVMFITELLRVFVGSNFHAVVPGRCYRSAQPTAVLIENAQREYHIRTIINLRDENAEERWYQDEKRAAERFGIRLIDAGLSSKEQAPAKDFGKVVQALHDAEEPILIHCANGNDRSGLASALYLLLRTDASLNDARQQFHLRYGHIPIGRVLCLQRTLDSYETWLKEKGWQHNPDHLLFWGTHVYEPEQLP